MGRVVDPFAVAAERLHQLGVIGPGDMHAVPDVRARGYAVGVVRQVVAPHRLIALVVEQHRHKGQVGLARDAKTLRDRVVQETAVAHESNHGLIGLGQFDAQRQAEPLPQASVGLVVTLGAVPDDVSAYGAAVGGDFLGVDDVVGHDLAQHGA